MIETLLVFRNEYRLDLKKVDSILIPYLFDNSNSSLMINVEAVSYRKYKSVGRIDQLIFGNPRNLVASSHVLRFGNQELIFPNRGEFRLLFVPNNYLSRVTLEVSKMYFGLDESNISNRPTFAKPAVIIPVGNSKKELLKEDSEGVRQSYLLQNTGVTTIYLKYVAIGGNVETTTISATDYDFTLQSGSKHLDPFKTKNGLIAISSTGVVTNNMKVIEFLFT